MDGEQENASGNLGGDLDVQPEPSPGAEVLASLQDLDGLRGVERPLGA